jgi:tetratricopeptide (TPR) repeat protein
MAEGVEEIEESGASPAAMDSGLAAVALATAGRRRGASQPDAKLDAYLEKQGRLIDLQTEHLHEQRELVLSRLRWGRFSDRVRAAIQVMTALVGLAVAAAVGAMAWNAHEDHGVVIAAFSVPPDLAQRGLSGQVVASQVLDRLTDLQTHTVTDRPASTYANDWGGDIKVEIPETGVSIGELNRYLRDWLGSQTRITGEIVRTTGGVAVTARAGRTTGHRFVGADADIDKLIDEAAEAIYGDTQPYRYAVWLSAHGHRGEALATYTRLARSGPVEDRAWAYVGWATMLFQEGRFAEAASNAENALKLNPKLHSGYPILGLSLYNLGRDQAAVDQGRREIALLESRRFIGLPESEGPGRASMIRAINAFMSGDEQAAAAVLAGYKSNIDYEGQAGGYNPKEVAGLTLALDHDAAGAKQADANGLGGLFGPALAEGDWTSLASYADAARHGPGASLVLSPGFVSYFAEAYARTGRLAEAEAMLSSSPLDCYPCLRARGLVAALKRDWPASDRWYAEAARQGPSLPNAQSEWGRALMDRGDLDGSVAKFSEAHRISPHFADPIAFWAEALMAKGDYVGAIAKFTEADKYAPRWGRNHLHWGEALMLSGRYAEARAQYKAANGMDLSKPDRAALDVLLARTATGPLHG